MGPIGMPEMILIFIVALMLFGPKELPKIGRTVAKALNDFKRASNELKDTWQKELTALEQETQDIRSEITKETDQITASTSNYGESYYNQESSYDYGAYGYPDTSTDSTSASSSTEGTESTEPATADGAQLGTGESSPAGETPASSQAAGTGETHAAAPADVAPTVTAAQGTVPTNLPAHPGESATRDEASSL